MDVRFAVFFSFLCIELIPHSPDGLDQFAFIAQLAAQLFYMRVNRTGIAEIVIIPYVIQYLFSLKSDSSVFHKISQQFKFLIA